MNQIVARYDSIHPTHSVEWTIINDRVAVIDHGNECKTSVQLVDGDLVETTVHLGETESVVVNGKVVYSYADDDPPICRDCLYSNCDPDSGHNNWVICRNEDSCNYKKSLHDSCVCSHHEGY